MLTDVSPDRLCKLKELASILAQAIDNSPGVRDLSQLAKQYRETLKEIEEIEGAVEENDEIGNILSGRAFDGKPGAVRKSRS